MPSMAGASHSSASLCSSQRGLAPLSPLTAGSAGRRSKRAVNGSVGGRGRSEKAGRREAVRPNLMVYGTVGWACGKVGYTASNFAPPAPAYATSAAFSNMQGGWVAGGGPEWAIAPNWLARGEDLFY